MASGGLKKSRSAAHVPAWAQKEMQGAIGQANAALGTSYVGDKPLVAGANQDMLQGWEAARNAAAGQEQTVQGLQNIFGTLQNFGSENDPLLQQRLQQIADLTNRNLQENIMPGIRTGAVQAGQTGSSRQGVAEGIATRGAIEQAARSQTDLLANAEQQRLQALGMAQGAGSNLIQQQLAPAETLGMLGSQQRDLEQQQLQEGLMRQAAELERVTGLSNIISQQTSPMVGQENTSVTPLTLFGRLRTGQFGRQNMSLDQEY